MSQFVYRVQARIDGHLRQSRLYKQETSALARAERFRALGYAVSVDVSPVDFVALGEAD
jgi:hypothetical protein